MNRLCFLLALSLGGCTVLLDPGQYENGHSDTDASTEDTSPGDGTSPSDTLDAGPCGGRCNGDTPICNELTNTCVICTAAAGCGDSFLCAAGACVRRCEDSTSCEDPENAHCDITTGECSPCTSNSDCTGVMGSDSLFACDSTHGECVHCTEESEQNLDTRQCAGKSCNPSSQLCTATELAGTGACLSCLSDAECIENYVCVQMLFSGRVHTPAEPTHSGYCLQRFGVGCTRPYIRTEDERMSIGAVAGPFCGVVEAVTTCEAVLALADGKACECPAGGLCQTVSGTTNQCTYRCDTETPFSCPSAHPCRGAPGDLYCGGTTPS